MEGFQEPLDLILYGPFFLCSDSFDNNVGVCVLRMREGLDVSRKVKAQGEHIQERNRAKRNMRLLEVRPLSSHRRKELGSHGAISKNEWGFSGERVEKNGFTFSVLVINSCITRQGRVNSVDFKKLHLLFVLQGTLLYFDICCTSDVGIS